EDLLGSIGKTLLVTIWSGSNNDRQGLEIGRITLRLGIVSGIDFVSSARNVDQNIRCSVIWIVLDVGKPFEAPLWPKVGIQRRARRIVSLIVSHREIDRRSARWRIADWCVFDIQTRQHCVGAVPRHRLSRRSSSA